jgi:hypothetical protein
VVATKSDEDQGFQRQVAELKDLLLRYAKQETVEPLKALKRFLLYGIAGAVLLAFGTVMLALALLRGLQRQAGAHLAGHWSWVPYVAVFAYALVVTMLLVRAIFSDRRHIDRERDALRRQKG